MRSATLDRPSMGEPKLREKTWEPAYEEDVLKAWRAGPHPYRVFPGPREPTDGMDNPPPHPSGSWHVRPRLADALIDMIARAQRMLGRAVLFPFGLDRNGINIERTVEKKTGKALHRWDREAFIQECRKEIEAIGNGLLELAVRVGMSADFDHTYYTDSDEYRAFSQAIFLELWPKGLFYRGERPTFWCPVCETPLAEADIDYEERPSNLVWMKFPLTSKGEIRIATTRPELLAACRAVIVHPDDARFADLQGKKARVPLYDHEVPILAHPTAKPEFGSGAAMICSYGDMVDLQLFRELRLEPVKAIDEHGTRDGVPADAAPAARPRLDRQPDDRLADLPAAVLPHGDPALVLQEVRRDARATSGEILPTVEGSGAVREMPEVQFQGVRRRGPRVRHLDGLERVEPLPHPIPHGPGLLRRELSHLASAPGPRDRPDVALLHDAQIMARAEVEAVPSRLHSRTRPRRPRSRDASHPGERDRPVALAQAARRRRDPAVRRGRDKPGRRLPDQRGEDRRRREVRHETLERRALHLGVRGARSREAPALRRMDPRGAEPARRIVPRGLRGPEPVPPRGPGPGPSPEPCCPALRGDGEGPCVRGRHGRSMDAARVPAGSPAPPRARHPVLDGQNLAVRV